MKDSTYNLFHVKHQQENISLGLCVCQTIVLRCAVCEEKKSILSPLCSVSITVLLKCEVHCYPTGQPIAIILLLIGLPTAKENRLLTAEGLQPRKFFTNPQPV